MTLWIIFASMTAAAMLAVLWPLGRKAAISPAGGNDLLVYQDQLEEIVRDRDAGLIGQAEAEAARVEVSRRLLAAADTALYQAKRGGRNRVEAAEELPLSLEKWRRKTAGIADQRRPGVPSLA